MSASQASSSSTGARANRSGSTSSASAPPATRTARTTAPFLLVGHSHIPIALRLSDTDSLGGGLAKGGSEIELNDGGRWLLNPGSVGQPRDGDPRAAYLLIDFESGQRRTSAASRTGGGDRVDPG